MRHNPLWFKMAPERLWMLMQVWLEFARALAFTVMMIYQVRVVGLDPLQLVLVGTSLEISVLIFEVPTGIVADTFSRRVSVIIGMTVIGIGRLIEALFPFFLTVALGQFIWGIGATFNSGAAQAWLTDEVGEAQAGRVFLRGQQMAVLGAAAGILLSVVLGSVNLQIPIILSGLLMIGLGGMLLLVMPEDGYRPTPAPERQTFGRMVDTFKGGVSAIRVRPLLLTLILITFFFAAQSESYDRLWTPHLLNNFTLPGFGQVSEVVWFGILRLSALAIAYFLIRGVRHRINTEDAPAVARSLTVVTVLLVILFIVFAQIESVWIALLCVMLIGPLRELLGPLRLTLINRGLEPQVRATVISMDGQTDAIGQISGGPVLGIVGRELGIRTAISLGALMLIPAIPLGLRTIGLSRKLPPIKEEQE